ncbi:MAG: PAS domain S-box protein [Methanoregula sp.]
MNGSQEDGPAVTEAVWMVSIIAITVAVIAITIFFLSAGTTTIFMHLYYLPIVLLAYHYRKKGFYWCVLLSLLYLSLVMVFAPGNTAVIGDAGIRAAIFIGIAALVAYLSGRLFRMNEVLAESEGKYRAFFTTSADCVFITTPDGKWVDFNDAAVSLFGYDRREELMDVRISSLYANPAERDAHIHHISEKGYSREYPVNLRKKDGTIISTLITSVPRRDPEGNIICFQGTIRDITDRKKAEERLNQQFRFLQRLIDTIPNPVFYKDRNGFYTGCNIAFEAYVGLPRDQLVGRSVYDIAPKDLADIYYANDKKLLDNAGTQTYESRVKYADGSIHDVIFNKAAFTDLEGNVDGLVGVILDITKRKNAEDALRQANKKLNLLSSITRHDINNQLLSLKGFLELSKESLDDPAKTSGYIIKEERAADAIERQIAFTKEYQDLGVQAPAWQKVGDVIRKTTATLLMRDIRLVADLAGLEVYADPLLEKVFYNLIDNALRYGGARMTEIRISSAVTDDGLIIAVEDDGTGISAENRKRLFERGFGQHTGLGLFLSREILAITGITVAETSEPGNGARFEIHVPEGGYRFTSRNQT